MANNNKTYRKKDSFVFFKNTKGTSLDEAEKKLIEILSSEDNISSYDNADKDILRRISQDLLNPQNKKNQNCFSLKKNTLAELNSFENDREITTYLVHRYRYEIFPVTKEIHTFPPLVQIEPSSICNFRCVFCFETDKSFSDKNSGHMGTMKLEMFKNIIDQIKGKVEFVTLASRGEPLISKDINKMIEYTSGKFLNLKINTNASLLNEEKSHSILSSNVKTVVFSADAADEDLYKKLRVNGNLAKTLENIKNFIKIKEKHYPKNKVITRVSGVKFSDKQNFEEMEKLWGNLVDQVVFVDYNPWENSYQKETNEITEPCSDLWRRLFVWWDGKINPCDVDYKSLLSVGNITENNIDKLWSSDAYQNLRTMHLEKKRASIKPCNACTVV